MTDGTMIRPRPRGREDLPETEDAGNRRGPSVLARRAAATTGAVAVLAVSAAGMFALFGPGQTVRGTDPRVEGAVEAALTEAVPQTPAAVSAPAVRGAEPGEITPAKIPVIAPPKAGKQLGTAARRQALVSYLERAGVPVVSGPAKVVEAARETCAAMDGGAGASDFLADLSRSAGYTAAQGTAFFVGATHFYCPEHSGALSG